MIVSKYDITYTLEATERITADSWEEAQSKLKDALRDGGINLHQAKLKIKGHETESKGELK